MINKKFKLLQDFQKTVKYPNHVKKVDYRHELTGNTFSKYIKDNIEKFCCYFSRHNASMRSIIEFNDRTSRWRFI